MELLCADANFSSQAELSAVRELRAGVDVDRRRIDFLLHGPALLAEPLPVPVLTDASVLPSQTEPSDHVPLAARLTWAAAPLPSAAPPR